MDHDAPASSVCSFVVLGETTSTGLIECTAIIYEGNI